MLMAITIKDIPTTTVTDESQVYEIEQIKSLQSYKILWCWDTAGISSLLKKYISDRGITGQVITRGRYDLHNLSKGIKVKTATEYRINVLLRAFFYDIIHLNSYDPLISTLKRFTRKPVLLHYHGTRIRNKWKEREKYWRQADKIIVSTPDLLEEAPNHVDYLPNVINEERFARRSIPQNSRAIHLQKYKVEKEVTEIARVLGLKLDIKPRCIPNERMPKVLENYEYLIDWKKSKNGKPINLDEKTHSKLELEALSMGLKVVKTDGTVFSGFPENHRASNVIDKLMEIYEGLLHD